MPSVHDVAAYILDQAGPMTAMKLQKLVYYSQAWHLVWDDDVLFPEPIEAWANGPVVPALYAQHRGRYTVEAPWRWGSGDALTDAQRESIDEVLNAYGSFTAQQLSVLSHSERPWQEARRGLQPLERGSEVIEPTTMADYYGSLLQDDSPSEPVRGSAVPED
ncbi:Prophage ps3 protein 01 [Frankia canadensis]|uniref:Prophage ps3 protein 01 n=1 Tax=Frankia canadensis TaxID=1836972 RepID=A0A2I2KN71_9ACTN|nr:type II toxin-antitoxin system antitoxin SocA domain-containing protein [Frankia canadensis]SNQ47092.1 Prophage ps3 protein 01 [Frankia canadensis]SOU54382.1 Prophage ps3 protein 01 [Frankia canadensis]